MSTIHNPSQFNPEDYTAIDYIDSNEPANIRAAYIYDKRPEANAECFAQIKAFYDLCEKYFGVRSAPHRCAHCGNGRSRYFAVAHHAPTNTNIAVGHICADHRLGITTDQFQWDRLAQRAKATATEIARSQALIALEESDPELHRAWLQAREDGQDLEGAVIRESAHFNLIDQRDQDTVRKGIERGVRLLADVAESVRKYKFAASEKQRALLVSGLARSREFIASGLNRNVGFRAHEEAKATLAATAPVLSGRQVIRGTIASIKHISSDYGTVSKAVVHLPSGQTVYVSLPAGLLWRSAPEANAPYQTSVGSRVEIVCTLEQSDRDPLFYFGSRPTVTPAYKAWYKANFEGDQRQNPEDQIKPYAVPA